MVLYWPTFNLMFLIHLFLNGGVYCILQRSRNKLTWLMCSSRGGGSSLGISTFKEKNSQNALLFIIILFFLVLNCYLILRNHARKLVFLYAYADPNYLNLLHVHAILLASPWVQQRLSYYSAAIPKTASLCHILHFQSMTRAARRVFCRQPIAVTYVVSYISKVQITFTCLYIIDHKSHYWLHLIRVCYNV